MIIGQLALIAAALFSGAAVYVSLVEHPARLLLDNGPLLQEFKPSYKRGATMRASIALVGFLLGIGAWWSTGHGLWILGAVLMLANWPYTLLVILPLNNQLLETEPAKAGPETRGLIQKWGSLHAVRTALGIASVFAFLSALH